MRNIQSFVSLHHALLGILALYTVGFLLHIFIVGKAVYGDGRYYVSWLRSIVIDADINFTNEYTHYGISEPALMTGNVRNIYSIGPALLWAPTYVAFHALVQGTGYEWIYEVVLGLTNVCLVYTGMLIMYYWLKIAYASSIRILALATLALSTNILFYGSIDPITSHAPSFFIASLYIFLVEQKRIRTPGFILGIVLGLLTVIRVQDIVFALLIFGKKKPLSWYMYLVAGFFSIFSLQIIAWYMLYGYIVIPYTTLALENHMTDPKLFNVLFSSRNGLLFWTPSILIGIIGLFSSRQYRYILLLVLQLYIVSSWHYWWQGASYSGRMFISLLPLITFGFAQSIKQFQSYIPNRYTTLSIILTLGVVNMCCIVYYLLVHP